jgi:hypothetical protein
MKKKRKSDVEVLTKVNAVDLLASIGIVMMRYGQTIEEDSDTMYSREWCEEAATQLQMFSVLLHEFLQTFPHVLRHMTFELPDGIGAMSVPNPYFRRSAPSGQEMPDEAAYKEGGSDSIDELPF